MSTTTDEPKTTFAKSEIGRGIDRLRGALSGLEGLLQHGDNHVDLYCVLSASRDRWFGFFESLPNRDDPARPLTSEEYLVRQGQDGTWERARRSHFHSALCQDSLSGPSVA